MTDRWPDNWFERLVSNMKLNAAEYSAYVENFRTLKLTPDPSAHEDYVEPETAAVGIDTTL